MSRNPGPCFLTFRQDWIKILNDVSVNRDLKEAWMDRRKFFKTMLAAPLLFPLTMSANKSGSNLELYTIADEPQLFLPTLLDEIQKYSSGERRVFGFLNSHPVETAIKHALLKTDWSFTPISRSANLILSFSHLRHKALPSFTLVRNERIQDIRSRSLLSLWRKMNEEHEPSSCLTIASLKRTPLSHASGKFVSVYRDGQKVETLPLTENIVRAYPTPRGRITARIEDGKAWLTESSCRHEICLHSPPVSLPGERIICAPNHFLLEIQRTRWVDTVIG